MVPSRVYLVVQVILGRELAFGQQLPVALQSTESSFSRSPASLTMAMLLFLPKGGLVITTLNRSPGSLARLSTPERIGQGSASMPCKYRFMMHNRAVLGTNSHPLTNFVRRWRFWSLS